MSSTAIAALEYGSHARFLSMSSGSGRQDVQREIQNRTPSLDKLMPMNETDFLIRSATFVELILLSFTEKLTFKRVAWERLLYLMTS